MEINKHDLFFFSTEGYSPELPTRCAFIKTLHAKNNREVALVKCDRRIAAYGTEYLVLVPKHKGVSLLGLSEDPVFTYVLNGAKFKDEKSIDLSAGHKIIIDWGGVSTSMDTALQWQVAK